MGRPTVIFSGMIATAPGHGGATWAILQYLLGFRRLGWDVVFVEPIDLSAPSAHSSVAYCASVMEGVGLADRWSLVDPAGGDAAGLDRASLIARAAAADVLINVSGMLSDPDVLDRIATRVYLDLDPAFVQLWNAVEGIDMRFDAHTHFITVGDGIGQPGCTIPGCGRDWGSTLPPVVLGHWPVAGEVRHDALTTVANWRGYGSIHHGGIHYGQKAHSWRPLLDLPHRVPQRFAPALAIHPGEADDIAALRAGGWDVLDPAEVAGTPRAYRTFVQGSWAELAVAKSGYVASRSGWFSDRSACYLASGRPVIAQDTGFGRRLPVGSGLLAFADGEDVVTALAGLLADYEAHRRAARAIAEEHLDSDRVLVALLGQVT
jgi:hypothetical protein